MKLELSSEDELLGDEVDAFKYFIKELSIEDLLALHKIMIEEVNDRMDKIVYSRQNK